MVREVGRRGMRGVDARFSGSPSRVVRGSEPHTPSAETIARVAFGAQAQQKLYRGTVWEA